MQFEVKFKSIAMRWFVNIFLVVAAAICAVAIAFSAFFFSFYNQKIEDLANDYAYEFYSLSGTNKTSFVDATFDVVGRFKYKDKIEVQVFNSEGEFVVSTTGFTTAEAAMPDYHEARENGRYAVAKCETAGGEQIMAGTTVLYDASGRELGAYRWITSMKSARRMMGNFVGVLAVASLMIIGFCTLSGVFFIKSIVYPIKDVSNTARKIAAGDFGSRIEVTRNDEIGELCDTINYMATELDKANGLKNEFISSVSHELRTPLTAIRGWGETAKMSLGCDVELVERGLDVVLSEADRLSGLVEELLDFSRMERGRMEFSSQPVDITRILAESVDMYTELSKKQGIELVFNRYGEATEVLGDPNRLKQVFINIIDNAVKYTEKGGQVLVVQTVEEACVRITVKDTGVGIPAQDIDRVKEKFYKANKTVRGSGIGLAVADEIIKQHQGLLFVESLEGVGTTVTIVLPLYELPEPEPLPLPETTEEQDQIPISKETPEETTEESAQPEDRAENQ